ncbi:unnamed protein product [Lota lota]
MATDLTEASVLCFLQRRGGTVKNSELLSHFKTFLRDHDDRLRHRERFKKFVNSVATVKQEEGVSYVILRKKFRAPDYSTRTPDVKKASDPGADLRSWSPAHRTPGKTPRPHSSVIPHPDEPRLTTPTGDLVKATESNILASAGIILNNNNYVETNFNLVKKPHLSLTPDVPQRAAYHPLPVHGREEPVHDRTQVGAPPGKTAPPYSLRTPATWPHKPVDPRVENHPASAGVQSVVETTSRHDLEEHHLQEKPSPILHQHEGLHHNTYLKVRARGPRYRKSYKSAVSQDGDDEEEEEEATEVVPRGADSAGGEMPLIRPQDNRTVSSLPPSLTPSLPSSQPPTLHSFTPSSLPPSLTPSLPSSQPPTLHSFTPSSLPPNLTPSLPSSQPPTLPSLTPSLTPSLHSSLTPSLTPSFPFPLHSSLTPSLPYSLPPSLNPSLPSSQPPNLPSLTPSTISPFLSTSPSPQSQTSRKFSSSPGSRSHLVPTIHIQDLEEPGSGWGSVAGSTMVAPEEYSVSGGMPKRPPVSSRRGPGGALGTGLSSSQDSLLLLSSSCSDWLSPLSSGAPSGAEWNSSHEELAGLDGTVRTSVDWHFKPFVYRGVRVANDNRLLSLMHRSEQKTTTPWHHSTGHLLEEGDQGSSWYNSTGKPLDNQEEAELSEVSPPLLRRCPAAARRVSSRLKSRKCLSLGAGLDLPFPGEEEMQGVGGAAAARRNRLTLLSSSLSLGCNLSSSSLSSSGSTPPRFPSVGELAEGKEQSRGGGAGRGTDGPHNSSYCHRQVPLEPKEHTWLVKGAAGAWIDIYSLFRDDPSLLQRPDFISGFTILHWIAKHGDHRVLNTLWYGAMKAGLTLEVNVRSWSGHTPLHLAAMHGHKKMIRLLVHKFQADVRPRDTAGKRAWQYLEAPPPLDLLHLLGAPQGAGGKAPLHHHASCSAADRPQRRPLTTGSAGVKRSTSIAAFLKHKTLLRFKDLSDVHV